MADATQAGFSRDPNVPLPKTVKVETNHVGIQVSEDIDEPSRLPRTIGASILPVEQVNESPQFREGITNRDREANLTPGSLMRDIVRRRVKSARMVPVKKTRNLRTRLLPQGFHVQTEASSPRKRRKLSKHPGRITNYKRIPSTLVVPEESIIDMLDKSVETDEYDIRTSFNALAETVKKKQEAKNLDLLNHLHVAMQNMHHSELVTRMCNDELQQKDNNTRQTRLRYQHKAKLEELMIQLKDALQRAHDAENKCLELEQEQATFRVKIAQLLAQV